MRNDQPVTGLVITNHIPGHNVAGPIEIFNKDLIGRYFMPVAPNAVLLMADLRRAGRGGRTGRQSVLGRGPGEWEIRQLQTTVLCAQPRGAGEAGATAAATRGGEVCPAQGYTISTLIVMSASVELNTCDITLIKDK